MEKPSERTERIDRKPNLKLCTKLSQGSRYGAIRQIETWILPASYLATISRNDSTKANAANNRETARKGGSDANSNG